MADAVYRNIAWSMRNMIPAPMIVTGRVRTHAMRILFTVANWSHRFPYSYELVPAILEDMICVVETGSPRLEADLIVIAVMIAPVVA